MGPQGPILLRLIIVLPPLLTNDWLQYRRLAKAGIETPKARTPPARPERLDPSAAKSSEGEVAHCPAESGGLGLAGTGFFVIPPAD